MISVIFGERFVKASKKLPSFQQEKLSILIELLRENPFHTKLHTKLLVGELSGLYSFRITRDFRVIFQFLDGDKIRLVDVGHRKEIYK